MLFRFRCGETFFIAGDRERVETLRPWILISSRYEELGGDAGNCDVPGVGEFSGLPAPINTAAGQLEVFIGRTYLRH